MSAFAVRLASLPAMAIVIWRLGAHGIPKRAAAPLLIIAAAFAVGIAQLVPLPPDLWSRLPGRDAFFKAFALIGERPPWLPLSLTPADTWDGLLALTPPTVMFASTVGLDSEGRWRLAAIVTLVAVLGVFLGAAQLFEGVGSPLRLYFREDPDAVGFFSNRDFYTSMLAAATPFAIVAGAHFTRGEPERRAFWMAATGATILVLIVGLATAKSRAGVLLAPPAAAGAAIILLSQPKEVSEPGWKRHAPALVALGATGLAAALVVALAFTPIAARFHETLAGDLRLQLGPGTVALAERYAPFGTGLGSFEPVYETMESPDHLIATFAGHAHNDFLEYGLEAGWPGVALMGLFLIWLVRRTVHLIRRRGASDASLGLAGALVVALLLAHSLVEFPLRTPALATLFAFACGLMIPADAAPGAAGRRKSGAGASALEAVAPLERNLQSAQHRG
jgi:O-antigen ligase